MCRQHLCEFKEWHYIWVIIFLRAHTQFSPLRVHSHDLPWVYQPQQPVSDSNTCWSLMKSSSSVYDHFFFLKGWLLILEEVQSTTSNLGSSLHWNQSVQLYLFSPGSGAGSRRRKDIKHMGVICLSDFTLSHFFDFIFPGITYFFLISTFALLRMWMCRSGGCVEQSCYRVCTILLLTLLFFCPFLLEHSFYRILFVLLGLTIICWDATWPSKELHFAKYRILLLSNMLRSSLSVGGWKHRLRTGGFLKISVCSLSNTSVSLQSQHDESYNWG